MIALTCGLAVLGVIEIFHLAVTTTLVRRLRNGEGLAAAPEAELGGPEIGERGPQPSSLPGVPEDTEVLIGFFSSGCPACRAEVPRLTDALPALARAGVRPTLVLAGAPGEDRDRMAALLEPTGAPALDEAAGSAFRAFGVKATPTFLIVRPDGTVTGKGSSVGQALRGAAAHGGLAAARG